MWKLVALLLVPVSAFAADFPNYYGPNSVSTGGGGGTTTPGGTVTGANQFRTAGGTFGGDDLVLDDGAGSLSVNGARILVSSTASNLFFGPGAGNAGGTSANGRSIGIGQNALQTFGSGIGDTCIGWQSCQTMAASNFNTGLGYNTLTIATGNSNTAFGTGAGNLITSGASNIVIGSNANVFAATGSSQLSIGNAIYGNIGSGAALGNLIGINVTSPTVNLEVSGSTGISGSAITTFFNTTTTCTAAEVGKSGYSRVQGRWMMCNGANSFIPNVTTTPVSASAI